MRSSTEDFRSLRFEIDAVRDELRSEVRLLHKRETDRQMAQLRLVSCGIYLAMAGVIVAILLTSN